MSSNELMTVAEVAEELRLTPPTVRRRSADGTLPAIRIGSATLRFRRADIDALLQPTTNDAHEEQPA